MSFQTQISSTDSSTSDAYLMMLLLDHTSVSCAISAQCNPSQHYSNNLNDNSEDTMKAIKFHCMVLLNVLTNTFSL